MKLWNSLNETMMIPGRLSISLVQALFQICAFSGDRPVSTKAENTQHMARGPVFDVQRSMFVTSGLFPSGRCLSYFFLSLLIPSMMGGIVWTSDNGSSSKMINAS